MSLSISYIVHKRHCRHDVECEEDGNIKRFCCLCNKLRCSKQATKALMLRERQKSKFEPFTYWFDRELRKDRAFYRKVKKAVREMEKNKIQGSARRRKARE